MAVRPRLLVALLVLAVLGPAVRAQRAPSQMVQPATYRSSDGRHELHVDPSSRWGSGPARYRLSLEGRELWSVEHPFTLYQALVSSSGVVVGYAYTGGIRVGDFVVVALEPDGTLRREDRRRQVFQLHQNPEPWARGLYLLESEDRFVIRMGDWDFESRHETWRVFRLSTGEHERELDLHANMEDPTYARWSTFAAPLPGTPLVLSQWNGYRKGWGSRYCLSTTDGRIVWQHDRPLDGESPAGIRGDAEGNAVTLHLSEEQRERMQGIESGASVLALGPDGCFELWFARDRARVSLRATIDAGAWKVEEVGRKPLELGELLGPPASPSPPPRLELQEHGRFTLLPPGQAQLSVGPVTVDALGHIYLADAVAPTVHVFDAGGWLHTSTREGVPMAPESLAVRGDGHLFLRFGSGSVTEFGPDGVRIADPVKKGQRIYLPGSARCWRVWDGVQLLDEDGKELCQFQRDSDDRWFERPELLGISPRGEPLILVQEGSRDRKLHRLDLRDADGKARTVIPLSKTKNESYVGDRHEGRVAVAAAGELLLFTDDGKCLGSMRLPESLAATRGLFFSPDGRELWLFSQQAEMLRLAVP